MSAHTLPDVVPAGPVALRRLRASDATELVAAYAASLPELSRWFTWARSVPDPGEQALRLDTADRDFAAGTDFHFALTLASRVIGELRLNPSAGPRTAGVGYWVDSRHHRRGYASAATRAITSATFDRLPDIDRIEIHMDQANVASVGVARAAGFRLDGEVDRDVVAPGHSGRGYVWVTTRPEWQQHRTGVIAAGWFRLGDAGS